MSSKEISCLGQNVYAIFVNEKAPTGNRGLIEIALGCDMRYFQNISILALHAKLSNAFILECHD